MISKYYVNSTVWPGFLSLLFKKWMFYIWETIDKYELYEDPPEYLMVHNNMNVAQDKTNVSLKAIAGGLKGEPTGPGKGGGWSKTE